ncbi:flippase-like domain-containing protein [candidate division GN15 bacterium]|nr:flippase-like domain-containing protein [candidate division GN15 bacterium]
MLLKNKQFWGTIIAILLLTWCLKDIRLSEVQSLSERVSYIYVIPAVLSAFCFMFARAIRWRLLISQQKVLRWIRAIGLYSAGQTLNAVMPALTGQVGRVILFSRKEGLKKTFIFSTIVLEVLFDALSLLVFLMLTSLAFAFPSEYRSVSYIIGSATLFLLGVLYVILHYQLQLEDAAQRHWRDKHPGLYVGIRKFIRSFTKGIKLLRSSKNFGASISLSLVSWIFHALTVYFLFKSFGFGQPFVAAAVIMIINTIALMIPITPGNAGTFEVAVSTGLAAFGVPRSDAVLFALALHMIDLLTPFIFGYLYLYTERLSLRELRRAQKEGRLEEHVGRETEYVRDEDLSRGQSREAV